eukprot:TRINITY_DN4069_c0_g1_i10.p4 TRINITY_DN4069_c0_g1~~TRINITY_DN4069_c0_g1_i10.p4  ORF type:complete len:145 (-),score=20.47 TRINITY_DN4069_c0_g1_i10:11864-12298(-)
MPATRITVYSTRDHELKSLGAATSERATRSTLQTSNQHEVALSSCVVPTIADTPGCEQGILLRNAKTIKDMRSCHMQLGSLMVDSSSRRTSFRARAAMRCPLLLQRQAKASTLGVPKKLKKEHASSCDCRLRPGQHDWIHSQVP